MMGDTPSGVVARRTCPSGVASFGRVTHAPADPRALYRAIRRSLLHRLGRRPGAPKWVPGWYGGLGWWRVASCSSWTRLSTCPLFRVGRRCCSWEAVQLLDKVADMPIAVPQLQFVKVVDDPVCAGRRWGLSSSWTRRLTRPLVVQFFDKVADVPVVLAWRFQTCRKLWSSAVAVLGQVGHARVIDRCSELIVDSSATDHGRNRGADPGFQCHRS